MSISLAADEEELRLVPIIHIMAVLSLPPDPLVSLKETQKIVKMNVNKVYDFFFTFC